MNRSIGRSFPSGHRNMTTTWFLFANGCYGVMRTSLQFEICIRVSGETRRSLPTILNFWLALSDCQALLGLRTADFVSGTVSTIVFSTTIGLKRIFPAPNLEDNVQRSGAASSGPPL